MHFMIPVTTQANHLTLEECDFVSLIDQNILKVNFLLRTILISLVFSENKHVVGMINLPENQCRRWEMFQIFTTIPWKVPYYGGYKLCDIKLRNLILIECTLIFGLDEFYYTNFD